MQRSLGLAWDLQSDTFTFQVSSEDKPYTKRGILSTVNSLFDPIGFAAPVTIQGKILLRNLVSTTNDWDEPLPPEYQGDWEQWRDSVRLLESIHIQRTYTPRSIRDACRTEIHIFSDASEKAIAAAAYFNVTDTQGEQVWSFILGKTKVAPLHGHTIPRLELCTAVLAVERSETISDHLDITPDAVRFLTDSRIVLGYIHNETRRFCVYVANRVGRIRKTTTVDQWAHIPTKINPADQGTRSIAACDLRDSVWLSGPGQLQQKHISSGEPFPLIDPDEDRDIKPMVTALTTSVFPLPTLGSHRFERFSSWNKLARAIAHLKSISRSFTGTECKGWHIGPRSRSVALRNDAELHIIRVVQQETFSKELECIMEKRSLPKNSPLLALNPMIDKDGLLWVGGRLSKAEISLQEKHPIIIPGRHRIATLLIRFHHENVQHQGRLLTEGAIRYAGLWIIGGERLMSSIIHKCVKCRKLRGKQEVQMMSELPSNRLHPAPAFTYAGVDTFGPWYVVTRKHEVAKPMLNVGPFCSPALPRAQFTWRSWRK